MPTDDLPGGARASFEPDHIHFPVSFELRLIVRADEAESLRQSVPETLSRSGIAHGPLGFSVEEGKAYARARLSVTFMDQDSMRSAYAALAALPGVKAVI